MSPSSDRPIPFVLSVLRLRARFARPPLRMNGPLAQRARSRRTARGDRGLTLVELMIAIALMLVVTLQLQIVFGYARKLYLAHDAMAQVYSNARSALDQIEKDVSNAVKTDQMEFFNDKRGAPNGVGHYQAGEENGTLAGKFAPGQRFIYAMAVKQPKEYAPLQQHKVGGPYRNDALYFRTLTTVDGQPREALVEYRLWLGANPSDPRERPILQRILTAAKTDASGQPMYDTDGNPRLERREPQDVCYYVQEFKIDLFLKDQRRRTVGKFYSPKEAIQKSASAEDSKPPALDNVGTSDEVVVQCVDGKFEPADNAIFSPQKDGKLHLRNGDRIARLGPGDKMYIRSKVYPPNVVIDMQSNYVTVKEVLTPNTGETVVSFEEEEFMKRQASGQADGIDVSYRGGWLPPAIRIQMKIKDARSEEIRTITRIFQLLRS